MNLQRVVHDPGKILRIVAHCAAVGTEDLSHHIRTIRGILEVLPEAFFDLQDGVYAKSVDGIIRNKRRDPSAISGPYLWALGVQVW